MLKMSRQLSIHNQIKTFDFNAYALNVNWIGTTIYTQQAGNF